MSSAEPQVTEESAEPSVVPTTPITNVPVQDWRTALSPDLRSNPVIERMKSVEDLAKEHINVQKLIGTEKLPAPKDDWTPEQFNDFYTKLGRPSDPKDYDLAGVERPEGLPWDDGFQESMVAAMHSAGMNSKQVKAVLGAYIESVGGQYDSAMGQMQQTREEGIQNLRNEWGRSFDSQIDLAKRAFMAGAGESYEDVASMTLSDGTKLGDHPQIIKAFAALGGKMSEHGLVGGTSIRTSQSPQEASGERNKLLSDPDFLAAYLDDNHREHPAAVKRINDLTVAEVGSE